MLYRSTSNAPLDVILGAQESSLRSSVLSARAPFFPLEAALVRLPGRFALAWERDASNEGNGKAEWEKMRQELERLPVHLRDTVSPG